MERIEKRAYSAPAVKSFTVSPQGMFCYSGYGTEGVGLRDGYSDIDFD